MEEDRNESLWAKDTAPLSPPLNSDLKVDVAVIGAGYTGLSAAFHIKTLQPDKEVVVLEARYAGHGASGRNGGMCLNQPSQDYMSMIHPDTHRLTYEATSKCIKELAELMRAGGYGSHIRFCGSLLANVGSSGAEKSKAYAAKASSLGMPIEFWDKARVKTEIGSGVYAGGLFDPNAAEAEPMMIVRALKKAAERAGVMIYEDSPVLGIEEGETVSLRVRGEAGQTHLVKAGAIVLGTDAYSAKLGRFRNKLIVTHTELASTKPLGKAVFEEIGWGKRIPFHDDRILLYHLGTTDDERIVIGAGNVEYFFNDGLTYKKALSHRAEALRRELVRIYPDLSGVEFDNVWSGPLTFSLDMSQSVGVAGRNRNVYYGAGYAGHGVTLAFLFGKVIADIHSGKLENWHVMPFFQNRMSSYLPPEPFRYMAVKSYIGYFRLVDKRKVK